MFTGIVEEVGTVRGVERRRGGATIDIGCAAVLEGTRVGDSISVNGCCLTVTSLRDDGFTADLMVETLDRTGLGALAGGAAVNLERALAAGARLGGHLVQGHVDGVAEVVAVERLPSETRMALRAPADLARYVVEKGSVTVDGTSLTVIAVEGSRFEVGLIPHTLEATALGRRSVGDRVNLEVDVVAKYVERLLQAGAATPYQDR